MHEEQKRLERILNSGWLLTDQQIANLANGGIHQFTEDIIKQSLNSPFRNLTEYDRDNPHEFILNLMRNPDYFSFTCKYLFDLQLYPFQCVILKELWNRPFPMLIGARGGSKTSSLALYAMLRALFHQGCKIVMVGAAFRQSKMLFEYCERYWTSSPLLRDIVGGSGKGSGRNDRRNGPHRDIDRVEMVIGDSVILGLPLADGKKIRGQRANYLITDEFSALGSEAVFENVVSGFAATTASPVELSKNIARVKILKALGVDTNLADDTNKYHKGNQSIIAGTAYYQWNHFYKYWKMWKGIIESQGDISKLENIFNGPPPANFNWKDYSVIRIPVESLPEGLMDAKNIARSKATMHTGQFALEFGAVFSTDSNGFFKRSLIEKCCLKPDGPPIEMPITGPAHFTAIVKGNPKKKYVYAIDPASERDNFSVIILELYEDHKRIVHCWTTTRQAHKDRLQANAVKQHNFYSYCARKIRDLMKIFPCARIAMDSQGGGVSIMEALHDPTQLEQGEILIWPTIVQDEPSDTDHQAGLHILEMINFADYEWTSKANHTLKFDLESKTLIFPAFDSLSLAYSNEEDKKENRLYDTLEDCFLEIEELKDELASIVVEQIGVSGKDRWDVPQVKGENNKKGRLRKDRYSALLMANAVANTLAKETPTVTYTGMSGGFLRDLAKKDPKDIKGDYYNVGTGEAAQYAREVSKTMSYFGMVKKRR